MDELVLRKGMHIHLVGIGGSGLSPIARILLGWGYAVSGSDKTGSELTDALSQEGAVIHIGHHAGNIAGADMLLISSAIPRTNPEVTAAKAAGIPVLKRNQFLEILLEDKFVVAIAGAHGKTTTTGMLVKVMLEVNRDPSFIVGGVLIGLDTNARAGTSDLFIIEADEYDRMFLGLHPKAAILTIVEHDHPDCYPTEEEMVETFGQFVAQIPRGGFLAACTDDPNTRKIARNREKQGIDVSFYGFGEDAGWRATDVRPNQAGGSDFLVWKNGETLGLVRLRIPGKHNILNSLAVLAVADRLGVSFGDTRSALTEFRGVARRFEITGDVNGITVVDDYAHHPTEISATLDAARQRFPGHRLWVVFQPHTYSRTKALWNNFLVAFNQADKLIVMDIYAAREQDTLGISSQDLAAEMRNKDARHLGTLDQVVSYLVENVKPGDVVITLGAGDCNLVGLSVLEYLRVHA